MGDSGERGLFIEQPSLRESALLPAVPCAGACALATDRALGLFLVPHHEPETNSDDGGVSDSSISRISVQVRHTLVAKRWATDPQ